MEEFKFEIRFREECKLLGEVETFITKYTVKAKDVYIAYKKTLDFCKSFNLNVVGIYLI